MQSILIECAKARNNCPLMRDAEWAAILWSQIPYLTYDFIKEVLWQAKRLRYKSYKWEAPAR